MAKASSKAGSSKTAKKSMKPMAPCSISFTNSSYDPSTETLSVNYNPSSCTKWAISVVDADGLPLPFTDSGSPDFLIKVDTDDESVTITIVCRDGVCKAFASSTFDLS